MSYSEWDKQYHGEWRRQESYEDKQLEIARRTRDLLTGSKLTLLDVIDHNASKPMPAHHNRDLMTALLKMERIA